MNQVYNIVKILAGILFLLVFHIQINAQDFKRWEISYSPGVEFTIMDKPQFIEYYGISYKITPLFRLNLQHYEYQGIRDREHWIGWNLTDGSEVAYTTHLFDYFVENSTCFSLSFLPIPVKRNFEFELSFGVAYVVNNGLYPWWIMQGYDLTENTGILFVDYKYADKVKAWGQIFSTGLSYKINQYIKLGTNATIVNAENTFSLGSTIKLGFTF